MNVENNDWLKLIEKLESSQAGKELSTVKAPLELRAEGESINNDMYTGVIQAIREIAHNTGTYAPKDIKPEVVFLEAKLSEKYHMSVFFQNGRAITKDEMENYVFTFHGSGRQGASFAGMGLKSTLSSISDPSKILVFAASSIDDGNNWIGMGATIKNDTNDYVVIEASSEITPLLRNISGMFDNFLYTNAFFVIFPTSRKKHKTIKDFLPTIPLVMGELTKRVSLKIYEDVVDLSQSNSRITSFTTIPYIGEVISNCCDLKNSLDVTKTVGFSFRRGDSEYKISEMEVQVRFVLYNGVWSNKSKAYYNIKTQKPDHFGGVPSYNLVVSAPCFNDGKKIKERYGEHPIGFSKGGADFVMAGTGVHPGNATKNWDLKCNSQKEIVSKFPEINLQKTKFRPAIAVNIEIKKIGKFTKTTDSETVDISNDLYAQSYAIGGGLSNSFHLKDVNYLNYFLGFIANEIKGEPELLKFRKYLVSITLTQKGEWLLPSKETGKKPEKLFIRSIPVDLIKGDGDKYYFKENGKSGYYVPVDSTSYRIYQWKDTDAYIQAKEMIEYLNNYGNPGIVFEESELDPYVVVIKTPKIQNRKTGELITDLSEYKSSTCIPNKMIKAAFPYKCKILKQPVNWIKELKEFEHPGYKPPRPKPVVPDNDDERNVIDDDTFLFDGEDPEQIAYVEEGGLNVRYNKYNNRICVLRNLNNPKQRTIADQFIKQLEKHGLMFAKSVKGISCGLNPEYIRSLNRYEEEAYLKNPDGMKNLPTLIINRLFMEIFNDESSILFKLWKKLKYFRDIYLASSEKEPVEEEDEDIDDVELFYKEN